MSADRIGLALRELFPDADFIADYQVTAPDAAGVVGPTRPPVIRNWNEAKLGPLDMDAVNAKADEIAARPPPPPQSITRAQAKIQLHRAGLLDQVRAMVAADPELQLWFDEALQWDRASPRIAALGGALNLTAEQIDALFVAAAGIA
jgi:hypothetical protein